jgi:hypothetical protein
MCARALSQADYWRECSHIYHLIYQKVAFFSTNQYVFTFVNYTL